MEIGGPEALIALLVVVILFGPERVPKLARSLGESISAFRSGSAGDDARTDDDRTVDEGADRS